MGISFVTDLCISYKQDFKTASLDLLKWMREDDIHLRRQPIGVCAEATSRNKGLHFCIRQMQPDKGSPSGYLECQSHSPKWVQNTYCSGPNYTVSSSNCMNLYMLAEQATFGAPQLYPSILCPAGFPSLSPQTHEFPSTWFQKGRRGAESKFHSPTREKSPGGLEFLMKLKVKQNACLCQQAGAFWRLIRDGGREWGQDGAPCFGPASAKSSAAGIQSTLGWKQTASASCGQSLLRTIPSQSPRVSQTYKRRFGDAEQTDPPNGMSEPTANETGKPASTVLFYSMFFWRYLENQRACCVSWGFLLLFFLFFPFSGWDLLFFSLPE